MNCRSPYIAAIVIILVALLTGCNVTDQYYQNVDDVGKKIVTEWKTMPGVVDAAYKYVHGLDLGQQIHLQATLDTTAASDANFQELIEVARKHYWKSGVQSISMPITAYSTDNPPTGDVRTSGNSIHSGSANITNSDKTQVAELTEKYGPRPTGK